MVTNTFTLPDDPAELKKIIAKMQQEYCIEKEQLTKEYDAEIAILHEKIRQLYDKLFGKKSEKYFGKSPQLLLFDMPEVDPEPELAEKVEVQAHSRKKTGRKPLPDELPRVEVIHDLPEEEKVCACGAQLTRIGEEVSEKLDIIPADIRVIRHIRPKYSCKCCEGLEDSGSTVKISPVPPQIIPKGIASAGLLAHLFVGKFEDALPFYRQEKQFARLGVELGRATMCNWAMKVADTCQPLLELLQNDILSGPLINIDETTVQVLKEPGRSPTTKSYMWIFHGGDPERPSLLYWYHPTRQGAVASDFLEKYRGVVQTDGYVGYDFLEKKEGVAHMGCWAHVRRKFVDADKARGKNAKAGSTTIALDYIGKLYRIEREIKKQNFSPEHTVTIRQEKSKPLLADFLKWLEKKSLTVVKKSLLGQAVAYTLGQWHSLITFLDNGVVGIDNNSAENAIRPFVIGRKNWLFAGTPEGAKASAALYSLIETAKASGLNVYRYLRYIFEKLPFANTEDDFKLLLPRKLKNDDLVLPQGWSVV